MTIDCDIKWTPIAFELGMTAPVTILGDKEFSYCMTAVLLH
jgi:hypothetical protein